MAALSAGLGPSRGEGSAVDAAASDGPRILTATDVHVSDYPTVEAVRWIGQTLEQETDGRLKIRLYHSGQLGREAEAIGALHADLDRLGVAAVRGPCRPGLIEALYRQPGTIFRHNAHAVCLTPHADAREAVLRGDVHLGGLAGESWSRLISDRF